MKTTACTCVHEVQVATDCAETVETAAEVLLGRHFRRPEAKRHAVDYLRGLIAEVERKNGWQLAEQAGYAHPRGIQRVLDRSVWEADAVRDDLRQYVLAALGDARGVLVVDETSFVKQGSHSVGVARQYCGTLGKIANCQVGVFLGYASPQGHVGLDRALFLPREWLEDRARGQQVGLPAGLPYQTKPQLALAMLERALAGGVPAAWVVADEVYGSDGKLRQALEARGQAYVLTVRRNQPVTTWPPYGLPSWRSVEELVETIPPDGWERRSCGEGAQGPRIYDWALVPVRPALREGWVHAVLARRHPVRTEELAYSLLYAPLTTSLTEIVRAAGTRWTIEEVFKLAKGQVGLDQYEVRSWQGWHRHVTLALVALAALTIGARKKGGSPAPTTSRLPYPKSGGCSCNSSGSPPGSPSESWPGLVGAATTRKSPKPATGAVA